MLASHEDCFPPLRPAAAFCALLPPLPEPLLFELWLLPLLFPPRLEEPGEFEIAAARDLLIPFLRSPSYCLSFFTLDPWSLATTSSDLRQPSNRRIPSAEGLQKPGRQHTTAASRKPPLT